MKKLNYMNPFIIPAIILLFITGCKKTDDATLSANSSIGNSTYATNSVKGNGTMTTKNSIVPQTKALAMIVPGRGIGTPTADALPAERVDFTFADLK